MPITSTLPEAVEHFRKGRDLAANIRFADAVQEFDRALKLDPDFVLALAYRGGMTPGPEGEKTLEAARARASSVSQPERLLIDAMRAQRQGEPGKSADLWKQPTEAVPQDWRAQLGLGTSLYTSEHYADAIVALDRATSLNPDAGPAFNMIGYAHLMLGEAQPAIDALTRYAPLNQNEPNPQDSLGEALIPVRSRRGRPRRDRRQPLASCR